MANDLNRSIKIYIDGTDAQQSLNKIGNSIQKLRDKLASLNETETDYEQKKKELNERINQGISTQERYKQKVQETERVLKDLSGATYRELLAVQKQVRRELQNAVPGTEKYNAALEQNRRVTQQVAAAQRAMRVEVGAQGSALGRVADGFNRYAAIAASSIAALTGVTLTMRQCVDEYAKMEEAESQAIKYTGMTRNEVKQLNEEFKQMDTRTPREELNRLAGEAGKLGITGVEDVREFVEAANMINVALGEDLGEEAVNQIGKLSQMFGDESRSLKDNMLAIGSAVNQVAQSTSASEPYLVQFTARMGGVGKQAGLAVTDIMGFASALDQNMLRSEMASTALSGLIMRIYQEPAKFAKLARMDVEQFTQTVQTDANEAVIQFLESLNKMGGMANIAPVLKEMQLSGAEAASVISTLAGNIDLVRKEQENASRAFREGTSITNEYNVQNNTVQAELEKARKRFQEVRVELGERLQPVMKDMISIGSLTVKGLKEIIDIVSEYHGLLVTGAATVAAYTAAVKLQQLWLARAERATKDVTLAQKALNAVMKLNPWGLALSGVTALVSLLVAFRDRTDKASESLKEMNAELMNEQRGLDSLFAALQKAEPGTERRRELIEEINRQYGTYLPYLLDEKSTLDEIKAAYDRINTAMTQQIALKHKNEAITKATEESAQEQMDLLEDLRQSVMEETGSDRRATMFIRDLRRMADAATEVGTDYRRAVAGTLSTLEKEYLGGKKMAGGMKDDVQDFMNAVYQLNLSIRDIEKQYEGWTDIKEENKGTGIVLDEVVVTPKRKQQSGGGTYTSTLSDEEMKEILKKEKQLIEDLNELREDDLWKQELQYRAMQNAYRLMLEEKRITHEQYNIMSAALDQNNADKCLAIEQKYYAESKKLSITHADLKEKTVKEGNKRVEDAEQQSFDKRLEAEQTYRRNLDALRNMSEDKPSSPEEKLKEQYQKQLDQLESYYQAALDYARKYGQNETEVTSYYNKAKLNLEEKYQEALKELKKQEGILRGNAMSEWFTTVYYNVDEMKKLLKDFKKSLTEGLGKDGLKDFIKDFSQLMQSLTNSVLGGISAAFNTFKQIEIDNVEAKYDAEIEAAAGNQERIEQLEHDKAAAKLEIEKKYADKEFAVKASQIIANTALAIMMAWAQLGPIAGAVAAALMTATGAIQLAAANAEREKVKNLTLDGSGSSSSSGGSGRRVATGRTTQHAAGRYDVIGEDDGRTYHNVPYIGDAPTGIVRSPALISENGAELIVNADDLGRLRRHVNYPLVVQAINDSRRPSPQASPLPQHAAGRYAPIEGASPSSGGSTAAGDAILSRLADTLDRLERNGINASVALTELDRKQQLRNKSRKIGSK